MLELDKGEIKRPGKVEGVIFLLYKKDQVLVEDVLRPDSGYYGHTRIPGGKIERGEQPAEAAKREAKEELGIIADKVYLLDSFEDVTLDGNYYKFHAFLITEWRGEVEGKEPEKSKVRWIRYPFAKRMLKLASSRLVLNEADRVLRALGQLPKG